MVILWSGFFCSLLKLYALELKFRAIYKWGSQKWHIPNMHIVPTPGSPTLAYNTGRLKTARFTAALNAECAPPGSRMASTVGCGEWPCPRIGLAPGRWRGGGHYHRWGRSSPHQLTCLGANLSEELLETLKRCHCHPNRMMHHTDFISNRRGDVAVPASLIVDHPSGRLSSRCSTVASLSPNVQAALIDDDAVPPARRLRGTTDHTRLVQSRILYLQG